MDNKLLWVFVSIPLTLSMHFIVLDPISILPSKSTQILDCLSERSYYATFSFVFKSSRLRQETSTSIFNLTATVEKVLLPVNLL